MSFIIHETTYLVFVEPSTYISKERLIYVPRSGITASSDGACVVIGEHLGTMERSGRG